jgi:hypothetical protein
MAEDYWERRRREMEEDRKHRERQRKYEIDSLRRWSRIRELDGQIERHRRQAVRDEAADKIRAEWSDARAAIEKCTAVPPELLRQWLERLESIAWYRAGSHEQIEALRTEVEAASGRLSLISDELRKAADNRNWGPLLYLGPRRPEMPLWERPQRPQRNPLLFHADMFSVGADIFSLGAAPERDPLAEDLRPIREQIRSAPALSHELRSAWLDQLKHVDDNKLMSASAARELAQTIDQHAESVRLGVVLITSSLTLLGSYCYRYHHP